MKRMSVFWGCTIPARFPFIEKSTRLVLDDMGAEVVEVEGYTCCPEGTLVKVVDEDAFYVTAARNLALAETAGLPILTPCNGCYSTFKSTEADLTNDWRRRGRVNELLGEVDLALGEGPEVRHFAEWMFDEVGPAALAKRVSRPLWGMRLGVHYGCHLLRPSPAVRWDSSTKPTKLEDLVRALGATVVDSRPRWTAAAAPWTGWASARAPSTFADVNWPTWPRTKWTPWWWSVPAASSSSTSIRRASSGRPRRRVSRSSTTPNWWPWPWVVSLKSLAWACTAFLSRAFSRSGRAASKTGRRSPAISTWPNCRNAASSAPAKRTARWPRCRGTSVPPRSSAKSCRAIWTVSWNAVTSGAASSATPATRSATAGWAWPKSSAG